MYGSVKTWLTMGLVIVAGACSVEVEEPDGELRVAAVQPDDCEEVYYYVVEGSDRRAAQAACDEVCEGVICRDPDEDAVAVVGGIAGNSNTWTCDCRCGCDNEDATANEAKP